MICRSRRLFGFLDVKWHLTVFGRVTWTVVVETLYNNVSTGGKKLVNLLLYSNFYIAFCAIAMTWQTQLLQTTSFVISPLIGLIFFATLLIYALHRLVGLYKVKAFIQEGRYQVIHTYKSHIWIYALVSLVGLGACFFQMNRSIQLALIAPGLISLGYVLPFLGKRRNLRLRDFNGIKIFLIAIVWAYVTVILPILEMRSLVWSDGLLFLERAFFIFAITLPFDIRDLKVDAHNYVKTIPSLIGVKNTLHLAAICLVIFFYLAWYNYYPDYHIVVALGLSAYTTYELISIAIQKKHDYYFTGLLDGTMWMQFIWVWLFWRL